MEQRRGRGRGYFNLLATKLNDPEAKNAGVIVAFQNVTGLKELERVRTDFIATISHEFKTPLTSIQMAASMLREGSMGELSAEQAETVEAMREAGDRLLSLVNDLLELMKLESGREAYRMAPCAVRPVTEASARDFSESARAKGVRLENAVEEGLPDVLADFEKVPLGAEQSHRQRAQVYPRGRLRSRDGRPRRAVRLRVRAGHRRGDAERNLGGDIRRVRAGGRGRRGCGRLWPGLDALPRDRSGSRRGHARQQRGGRGEHVHVLPEDRGNGG